MLPHHAPQHRQRGQYLIAALLALAVISVTLVMWASEQRHDYIAGLATAQGSALAQWGVGIRGYAANVEGGQVAMPGNPYTVTGVNWLKPPACGGLPTNPPQGYVPCAFTGGAEGADFQTTITHNPASNSIDARTWFMAPPENGGGIASRGDFASKIAFAAVAQQATPMNGMFLEVFANSATTATAPPTPSAIAPADRGRVLLVADNSPSNDIWLRVDGTNKMLADLNMGGNSLANAKNGTFSGDVRVNGTEQVDNGISVTGGTVDARGGVITPDAEVTGINQYASQGIYNAEVLTGSRTYTVPKPNCSLADGGRGSQPAIYAAMQQTGSPQGRADAIYDAGVQVANAGPNWIVTPTLVGTQFQLSGGRQGNNIVITLSKNTLPMSPTQQTVVVETKCR